MQKKYTKMHENVKNVKNVEKVKKLQLDGLEPLAIGLSKLPLAS